MPIALLLAASAAVGWGTSDFLGGHASQRGGTVFRVVAVSELLGIALIAPVLIIRGSAPPANPQLLLAALGGISVTIELSLIYRALSRGEAFITAPVAAIGSAAAVTIGLVGGDPFSLAIGIGLTLALLGSAISTWQPPAHEHHPAAQRRGGVAQTATICIAAAAAMGATLVCLHAAGRVDPYWATAIEHLSTGISAGFAAILSTSRAAARDGERPRLDLPVLALIAVAGAGGDLAYAAAGKHGALSTVAAIATLYPLITILLGRAINGRHASHIQHAGIALALTGAVILGAYSSQ